MTDGRDYAFEPAAGASSNSSCCFWSNKESKLITISNGIEIESNECIRCCYYYLNMICACLEEKKFAFFCLRPYFRGPKLYGRKEQILNKRLNSKCQVVFLGSTFFMVKEKQKQFVFGIRRRRKRRRKKVDSLISISCLAYEWNSARSASHNSRWIFVSLRTYLLDLEILRITTDFGFE